MKKYLNLPLCRAQTCPRQLQRGKLKLCGTPLRACPHQDKNPYGRYELEDILFPDNAPPKTKL